MPIIKEVPYGSALYDEVVELRRELLRRPLGLDFTPEELAQEKHDTHLAALDADRVVGTLLLRKVDERTARIMRMAVVPEAQGRAIGRALVEWAEGIARERGFETIMMHARSSAIGFYEKCGYHTVGGEFLEQGIPHIRMEKRLKTE
ncbi:MAG: GNAT family N-acetyltransferase [Gammaproteobacteria bacterium]|nr:GNAT family N-acetyltransferase [Gammaproteobacteria bacterium]